MIPKTTFRPKASRVCSNGNRWRPVLFGVQAKQRIRKGKKNRKEEKKEEEKMMSLLQLLYPVLFNYTS